jgi:transposase
LWAPKIPWLAPWLGVSGRAPDCRAFPFSLTIAADEDWTGAATVVQLGELMMILELHRQGLTITAIARRTGRDPKTIRKYIERGLELPVYGPRQVGRRNKLAPYLDYLRDRVAAFPDLSAVRLTREVRERGYTGAYTAVKRVVAAIRPNDGPKPFEVRFETPAGHQAQVDFARFVVTFEDEPGVTRIIWLFSLVLGHSRHIIARFVLHQDLQTLVRCHMAAFEAIAGSCARLPRPFDDMLQRHVRRALPLPKRSHIYHVSRGSAPIRSSVSQL